MKSSFFFGIIFLLVHAVSFSQAPRFFDVKGKEIIDPSGKPFLIRGTNLGNWLVPEGYMFKLKHTSSPRLINQAITELIGPDAARAFWRKYVDTYVTEADIHYLKSIGMNSIRVPFNYRLFTNDTYLGGSGEARAFAIFDKLMQWCRKESLYVILDMHCAPGGQTGDNIDDGDGYPFLFESEESQALTVSIWTKIAARYKDEPALMGYDLLNEPIATYFDSAHFNHFLEPLYKRIVKSIRTVDTHHLVFLGGSQWDSNFKIFGTPFDSKSVYTFHKYWTEVDQKVIQEYIDFRERYNVPIYVGETGENEDAWVEGFRKLVEANNIGWHFWPYKKMTNSRGIVTFPMPSHYEEIVAFSDTSRFTFKDIRDFRPKNTELIKKVLDDFITNSQFSHCTPNSGYIKALGLKAGD